MTSISVIQRFALLKGFNWKVLLIRFVANALALLITVGLVPYVSFVDWRFGTVAVLALGLGVLNALIKPILQFLTLNFIFVTYGFVVILINTLVLYLLAFIFRGRFAVDSIFWAIVAATLLGLLSSLLENLFGATLPIIPEDHAELRKKLQREVPSTAQIVENLTEAPPMMAPDDTGANTEKHAGGAPVASVEPTSVPSEAGISPPEPMLAATEPIATDGSPPELAAAADPNAAEGSSTGKMEGD